MTTELTVADEARLVELERVVDAGIETFVDVGTALAEINQSRLYRATHATFAAYAAERFGFGRAYAYRMINAAKAAELVSPIGDIRTESQARELVGLEPEQARETYRVASDDGARQPTAADLRAAREQVAPAEQTAPAGATEPDAEPPLTREAVAAEVTAELADADDRHRQTARQVQQHAEPLPTLTDGHNTPSYVFSQRALPDLDRWGRWIENYGGGPVALLDDLYSTPVDPTATALYWRDRLASAAEWIGDVLEAIDERTNRRLRSVR